MSDARRHRLDVGTARNEGGDVALAHSVGSETLHAGLANQAIKSPSDVGRVDGSPRRGGKDEVIVEPFLGCLLPKALTISMLLKRRLHAFAQSNRSSTCNG